MDAESASSVFLSRTLDELGYNQEMVRFRQQFWEKDPPPLSHIIVAGSKGEGLAKYLESDNDHLQTVNYILCSNRDGISYNSEECLTILQIDDTHSAPGYTMLICVKLGTFIHPCFEAALMLPIGGRYYLSSDRWIEKYRQLCSEEYMYDDTVRQGPVQGPSNPVTDQLGRSFDNVFAIACDCPDILEPWLHRRRRYNWPPAEILEEISTLEAHVVPVGFKESPSQFLEWRICFTRAEIKLIYSFNSCQTKLIILLKMIAKNSLKPVCKEMTSYVMKNVVFWIAELHPPEIFKEQNLLLLLTISLRFLKQCLLGRNLPSYMVPERNLLPSALGTINESELFKKTRTMIGTLLHEGPRMVLRCEKIRNRLNLLNASPELFLSFSNRSKQAEILIMLLRILARSNELDGRRKVQLLDHLRMTLIDTVLPDMQVLVLLGEDVVEFFYRRFELFSS